VKLLASLLVREFRSVQKEDEALEAAAEAHRNPSLNDKRLVPDYVINLYKGICNGCMSDREHLVEAQLLREYKETLPELVANIYKARTKRPELGFGMRHNHKLCGHITVHLTPAQWRSQFS